MVTSIKNTAIVLMALLIGVAVNAQQSLKINYEYGYLHADTSFPEKALKSILLVDGSQSYFYYPSLAVNKDSATSFFPSAFNRDAVYTDYKNKNLLIEQEPYEGQQFLVQQDMATITMGEEG